MGRDAIKANKNIWYQKRMEAAKYNDKLSSREGAAELLDMSVSSLSDTELGLQKFMPVDKAVRMADIYHAPELLNYYCLKECPIGCNERISCDVVDLDRLTVKLVSQVRLEQLPELESKYLGIARDGIISQEEEDTFFEIVDKLNEISKLASEFNIIAERLRNGRYEDEFRRKDS